MTKKSLLEPRFT